MQKRVMQVQSSCFTNKNLLLFLPVSLPSPSPSLLPKLLFVVIQIIATIGLFSRPEITAYRMLNFVLMRSAFCRGVDER